MAVDWDAELLGPVMAAFGETVIYTPRGGAPITIPDAVWDEATTTVVMDNAGEVTIQIPLLGIRAAALNGIEPAQSDRVLIAKTGAAYLVKNPEPDGHGHVLLELMKVSA